MKKLLSFLAVAAIVTSAFAFTNKSMALTYCVDLGGPNCALVFEKSEDSGGPIFEHYPLKTPTNPNGWDGTQIGCTTATTANDCVVNINLINN